MVALVVQNVVQNVQRIVMTDINNTFENLSRLTQRIVDLEYELSCLQKYKNGFDFDMFKVTKRDVSLMIDIRKQEVEAANAKIEKLLEDMSQE